VRLPAVLAAGVSMIALAGLAYDTSGKNQRAAFFGGFAYLLFLIGLALSLLITIDGPYMATWALAAWAGWRGVSAMQKGESGITAWLAFGVALGAGFLYKYTALLLVPGIALYLLWDRQSLRFTGKAAASILAGLLLVVLAMAPVAIWNANHDWVTIKHLLGHLQVKGGDTTVNTGWTFNPMTVVSYIGVQIGAVGPMTAALIAYAVYHAKLRKPKTDNTATNNAAADNAPGIELERQVSADRYLVSCAAPILLFYLAVSVKKEVEGNWPIAGYLTLLALVGKQAPAEFDRLREQVAKWIADGKPSTPRQGFFRARPESLFQVLWHWAVGTSVVVFVGIFALGVLMNFSFMHAIIPKWRVAGMAEAGRAAHEVHLVFSRETGAEPFYMASGYEMTALLSYYTPGRPVYVSGASELGQRESSYDYFDDTNWRNPQLINRPVVLAGTADEARWRRGFNFEDLKYVGEVESPGIPKHRTIKIFTAKKFLGPVKPVTR
jgi:undecaprenyl-diphosphatase